MICWYLVILQFGNLNVVIYLLKAFRNNVSAISSCNIQRKCSEMNTAKVGASFWIFVIKSGQSLAG